MPYRTNVRFASRRNRINYGRRRYGRRYKKRTGFKYASKNRGKLTVPRSLTSGIQYMKFRQPFKLAKSAFTTKNDGSLFYVMRFCPLKITTPGYFADLYTLRTLYAWYKCVKTVVKFTRPKQPMNEEADTVVLSRLQLKGGTQLLHPSVVYVSNGTASDSMTQPLIPYSEAIVPSNWAGAVDNTSDRFKVHGYGGGSRTWLPMTPYEKRWSQFASSDVDHCYGALLFAIEDDQYPVATSQDGGTVTMADIPDAWTLFEGTIETVVAIRTRI